MSLQKAAWSYHGRHLVVFQRPSGSRSRPVPGGGSGFGLGDDVSRKCFRALSANAAGSANAKESGEAEGLTKLPASLA